MILKVLFTHTEGDIESYFYMFRATTGPNEPSGPAMSLTDTEWIFPI